MREMRIAISSLKKSFVSSAKRKKTGSTLCSMMDTIFYKIYFEFL
jgi:hypothetical protein